MKIVVVVSSLVKGGAERVVSILTQYWGEQHEVKLALFDSDGISYEYGGEIVDIGAASGRGFLSKFYNPFVRIIKLYRLIRKEQPSMIFSFMESANFPTAIAASLAGFRSQLTVSVRNNPGKFPKVHQYLMPLLYRLPGRVVPISEGVGSWLKEHRAGIGHLQHIPNPIDIHRIDDHLIEQKSDNSFKQYSPYLLAVGRLHRQKGFDMLIDAFSKAGLGEVKLLILGEGQEREALQELINGLELQSRVLLLGNHHEPYGAYSDAVGFVMSSRYEGWGNVIMEAMCCRCPVISFDCDYGPSEIIEDGENGILVPAEDVGRLSIAMKSLVENEALRAKLADGGRERVENFAIEKVSSIWLSMSA